MLASYKASCTQMHFLSFCGVILSSCTLYYVHEEVVAVLPLAVVTKMSYAGLCQSVDPSPLILASRVCWKRCNAEGVQCHWWCGMCAKCVVAKFGGLLVSPFSTPGKEDLGKAFWAQLLAGLCI